MPPKARLADKCAYNPEAKISATIRLQYDRFWVSDDCNGTEIQVRLDGQKVFVSLGHDIRELPFLEFAAILRKVINESNNHL